MRLGLFALGVSCLCLALGCGSDDDDSSKSGTAGASGKGTGGSNASHAGTNAGGATGTSGSAAQAGTNSSGTSGGGAAEVPTSEACKKYCTCHEMNCATYAIPGGKSCAAFCAGMTEDQLACRQNMCKLVPDQPDNDHCTHSLGINQCE